MRTLATALPVDFAQLLRNSSHMTSNAEQARLAGLRDLFKRALTRQGLSQRAAAERAGISETRWRQVILGGGPATRLAQMAAIAGVSIGELQELGLNDAAQQLQSGDYPPIDGDADTDDPSLARDVHTTAVTALAAAQAASMADDAYLALPALRDLGHDLRIAKGNDHEILVLALSTALQHLIQEHENPRAITTIKIEGDDLADENANAVRQLLFELDNYQLLHIVESALSSDEVDPRTARLFMSIISEAGRPQPNPAAGSGAYLAQAARRVPEDQERKGEAP